MMAMVQGIVNLVITMLQEKIVKLMAYLFLELKAAKKFVLELVSKIYDQSCAKEIF